MDPGLSKSAWECIAGSQSEPNLDAKSMRVLRIYVGEDFEQAWDGASAPLLLDDRRKPARWMIGVREWERALAV